MDSVKNFVEDTSAEKKIFLAILAAGVAWFGYEVYSVATMNQHRKRNVGPSKYEQLQSSTA
jgi:predicted negative regulator of RcsB-dependent stress response